MNDEPDKREGKNPKQHPRQDRLKRALRENLKRRKSQAKGRSETTIAPRNDMPPHEENGKKRNE
jgi:hypothetical protein